MLILVNPRARGGALEEKWKELEPNVLDALGLKSADVALTSTEDHGSGTVRDALKKGEREILVVGGDGTISEAVQGFFENGKPVSPDAVLRIVPAGRGDDFFKMLVGKRMMSSDETWRQALRILREGKPEPMDVGVVTFDGVQRYWINVASFGFPGVVVQRVSERDQGLVGKSAWTYMAQSTKAFFSYKPIQAEVKVDGKVVYSGSLFSAFALNGQYNAGGVRWSNEARIDDGLLNVLVFEPRGTLATLGDGGRMLSGEWSGTKRVHLRKGREIEMRLLDGEKKAHPLFEIDGDQPEPPEASGAKFSVLPGAIKLWR